MTLKGSVSEICIMYCNSCVTFLSWWCSVSSCLFFMVKFFLWKSTSVKFFLFFNLNHSHLTSVHFLCTCNTSESNQLLPPTLVRVKFFYICVFDILFHNLFPLSVIKVSMSDPISQHIKIYVNFWAMSTLTDKEMPTLLL